MFVEDLLRRLGNDAAIDNARAAATELARRRLEHEAVEIFLERHAGLAETPPVLQGSPSETARAVGSSGQA